LGVEAVGITAVRYFVQDSYEPIRIRDYLPPGGRAVADLVLNELQFINDWVEIFDTTESSTTLTNPQIYLVMYHIDFSQFPPAYVEDANVSFSGSTNSNGFATASVSALAYSTSSISYTLLLRCNNCSGTGSHSTLDSVSIPLISQVARGAYGRYPDGGAWQSTDNNTQTAANTIPEFQDLAVPLLGIPMIALVARRRRPLGTLADLGPPPP